MKYIQERVNIDSTTVITVEIKPLQIYLDHIQYKLLKQPKKAK